MFGYVKPDNPYLYMKDDVLYRSFYCGLCKSLKKDYGEFARLSLTFDMSFMSCFIHNYLGVDIKMKQGHCITHVIRKTPIAIPDDISKKLAGINVMLAYYKGIDDKVDDKKGLMKRLAFKKGYKRAVKKYPEIKALLDECFNELHKLENEKCSSIDMVSDIFATFIMKVSKNMLLDLSTLDTESFFYNLGKWIYLIDALDDYDKDIKKKSYNVFYLCFGDKDYKTLINTHGDDISFVFNSIFMGISSSYGNIKMKFNRDLLDNIVNRGLKAKTIQIFNKGKKDGE